MKFCQIMVYGGRSKWIDLSLKRYPNTNWLILIGVQPTEMVPNYWEDVHEKIKSLETQQEALPKNEKTKYNYINLEFSHDTVRIIRYFRALITLIYKEGYLVKCNLTSGIFEIRIGLFLASQIESEKITEIFYIDKQNYSMNLLNKSFNITKKGKILLKIIYNENIAKSGDGLKSLEYNLTDLSNLSKNYNFKIDLPAVSRLVSGLVEKGFLEERREGRKKFVSLTKTGYMFCPIQDLQQIINNDLKKEWI